MSKLSNSWNMMKASATVLRLDPELLIFPLLSGIAAVLVTATFIVPFAFVGEGFSALENLDENVGYIGYVVGFLYYLVLYSLRAPDMGGENPCERLLFLRIWRILVCNLRGDIPWDCRPVFRSTPSTRCSSVPR